MRKKALSLFLALVMTLALAAPAMAAEYKVAAGDTLAKIAEKTLGDAGRWKEIYEANKDTIKDPNKIYVGQKLNIPDGKPAETSPVDEQKPAAEGKTAIGTAAGYEEDEVVTVSLTVAGDKIVAFKASSTSDSAIGGMALTLMPDAILAANSLDVDIVSGATGTSNAILAAARNAMAQINVSGIDLHQWALDNGYVLASDYNLVPADAITSATAEGAPSGINFGYISFDEEGMKEYVAEMLGGPYTWGVHEPKYVVHKADDFVDGVDLTGLPMYRDMCALGTAGNNIPNTATIELVYDPYTSRFYGSSEAGTSKVNEFKLNPYVTVTYMVQMTDKFFNELGYDGFTAYADYGKLSSVMVYGKIHVITEDDFDGGELEEKALRALDVYMPTYYGTRWPFKTIDSRQEYAYDDATERAAKVAAAKTELAGVSAKYYIEPYRITASLYSVYPPFQISNTSAWSTYKTFSIKTEEASAANGYTEVWTGITEDQYCQAVIATNPGGASAGIRYWYESDKSWDFTWSEDGKELLKVEEHKDGDASVRYVTPYKYPWVRDSLIQVTAKLRKQWAAENPDVLKDKAGEEGNLTFTRNVLVKDTEVSGEVKHAGVAVTNDEVAGLKLGTDYIKQQITMPNYIYYLVTTDYSMSAVQSQQNYTPYPEHNPSKATSSAEKAEEVLPEGVESDGEFHYTLLADGTYEIVKYAVVGGQSLTVDIPAEYKGVAVTSIGKEAFKDATNVGRINVPNSVTTFKEGAFYGVRSLKDMNVPASVKTIEKDCFNRTGWGNMNVDSFCIITFESMTPPSQELMMGKDEVGLDGTQVRIKTASAAAEATYKEAWAGLADLISKDWVNPS